MANFAELDNHNKVIKVEVVNNEVITDGDGVEQEQLGIDFLTELYGAGRYVQTSFSNSFRKNYAGKGMTYDSTRDAFIPEQLYGSWILNESTCLWEAPTSPPDDGSTYHWDEPTRNWIKMNNV